MEKQKIPVSGSQRIVLIDALRGFSLFGIMITHMILLFNAIDYSKFANGTAPVIDIAVYAVGNLIFLGKFFAIFAFLFGLSYFIQMDRASKKGINYQWRFLWRIIILLIIGFLHSLLYSGDILLIYATLGIPLVFMYKLNNKILIVLIIILLSGAPRFIAYGIEHLNKNIKVDEKAYENEPMYSAYKVYREKSFGEIIKFNAEVGIIYKAKYQLNVEGRAYQTLAMFLLGILVGRRRYFEQIDQNLPATRKVFKWSIGFTIGFLIPTVAFFILSQGNPKNFTYYVAMTFYNFFNLSFALLISTAFILLYQRERKQKFFNKLAPYGKMGLTNYMMQSIISIPILYGFGIGLATKMNLGIALLLGIAIYIIQVIYSRFWLNRFIYGPFEWLWRSLTWFKWQSFKR